MKILNPTAAERYNALKSQVEAIAQVSPAIHVVFLPPRPDRETATIGVDIPLPVTLINPIVRNALSRLLQDAEMAMLANTEKGICFTFTVSDIWIEEDEK